MESHSVDALLENRVSWLADKGPEDDIAISSRIRLARNISGIPFPVSAAHGQLASTVMAVEAAVSKTDCFGSSFQFSLNDMSKTDQQILFERRLASLELLNKTDMAGLIVSRDESFGVMINEEDHIRLQAMRAGCQLREVWNDIDHIDNVLGDELNFSFDEKIGYLTSCPTNIGTGMRASVMLHLPGLVLSNQINSVIHGVGKLGLAVRGIFGEGTSNLGSLYQVSNQSTLGETELQIIDRLEAVIKQIISHEKNARQYLLENKQNFLMNHVGRAYGILRHAYTISSEDTLNSLSALRLGVDMGMFSSVEIHTVNELFILVQPSHLQKYAGKELLSEERDIFRASIVRERLRKIDNNTH